VTEPAELTRAIVVLVEFVQQYGPVAVGVVSTLLAKKAVTHAKQASTDARAARDSSSAAATASAISAVESHTVPPAPSKREITDSGIIRIAQYLERRINDVDRRKAKHADEDAEVS
jgi:hypothetical protein